jgi:hypothetical protein
MSKRKVTSGESVGAVFIDFFKGCDVDTIRERMREFRELPQLDRNHVMFKRLIRRFRAMRHQKHYNQNDWLYRGSCGAVGCIGGHIALICGLSPDLSHMVDVGSLAQSALGIDDGTAIDLFSAGGRGWPSEYKARLDEARKGLSGEKPTMVAADLLQAILDGDVDLGYD